jgi:formate dehydrogenase iron-sulfur subunit
MSKAILFDATRCTGCRGCQVACKQWNELPADKTTFFGGPGYQNPADLSFNTYTVLEFHRDGENDRDTDGNWHFLKFQCMHCTHAACVYNCDYAYHDTPEGPACLRDPETGMIYIDQTICRGCALCVLGTGGLQPCPFGVPRQSYPVSPPKTRKCIGCVNRISSLHNPGTLLEPACVKSCNTDALMFGERADMVSLAATRAAAAAAKWPEVNVYGDTGPFGGLHVISVLGKPPEFYNLPPKSADLPDGRWAQTRTAPVMTADLGTLLASITKKAAREA